MPRLSESARSLVRLTSFVVLCAALLSGCEPGRSPEVRELSTGRTLEGCPDSGQVDVYRLPVAAGQYLEILIDQYNVDVEAILSDSGGRRVASVDNWIGPIGAERLLWVAEEPGNLRLEIRVPDGAVADGCYDVTLAESRPVALADHPRVEASRAMAEVRLREDATELLEGHLEVLERWRGLGDAWGQAETLFGLAFINFNLLHLPDEAKTYCEEALAQLERGGDPALEAAVHRYLGAVHDALGDMEQALASYQRALALKSRYRSPYMVARTENDLGYAYAMLGEYQEALGSYERALEVWKAGRHRREESRTLHNRAKRYAALGRYAQALDDYLRALEIRREIGDRWGQASTLTAMGQVYERQGELLSALEVFEEALKLRREVGDRRGEAVTLTELGPVYYQRGSRDLALEILKKALATFVEGRHERQEASAAQKIGWIYGSEGEAGRALDFYGRALAIARRLGARDIEAATLLGMAIVERGRGRLLVAWEHAASAIGRVEALRLESGHSDLRSSFFATKQNYYELCIDLLFDLHRQDPTGGHAEKALEMAERARARSLLETLAESRMDVRRDGDIELLDRDRELSRAIHATVYRLSVAAEEGAEPTLVRKLDRRVQELLRKQRILRGEILASSPRYAALVPSEPLPAEEIRGLLDGETLLLEYHLGEERGILWAVTEDAIESFELPGRMQIEAPARLAHKLLSTGPGALHGERTQELLADLGETLLRPVADLLERPRLLIVSEGVLQYVPFGALPAPLTETATGTLPLVAEHEIVNMASISALSVLRELSASRPPATGLIAVVADPVFNPEDSRFARPAGESPGEMEGEDELVDPERLPYSKLEAEKIRELVGEGERSFEALGFDANREVVLSGGLAGFRYVHFATHGELNTARPELSALVLSTYDREGRPRDGDLRVHDIYGLDLPAELVVLSACRTALGEEVRGEGLVGLTQGFLYAGAARVLVSLWNVRDNVTAELMGAFYEALIARGLSPSAALQEAQNAIRNQEGWREPYYWSGFVLVGDWR